MKIESQWRLFGTVIPSDSRGLGRQRTPYFYRREAVAWSQMARHLVGEESTRCLRLAVHYLRRYREVCHAKEAGANC